MQAEPSSSPQQDLVLPQYIHDAVGRIAVENGFTAGQFRVDFQVGSDKGDGFSADMFRVRVTEQSREWALLCKVPPISVARRRQFDSMAIFEREVDVYSKLLPAIYAFQREKGVREEDGFFSAPNCYLSYYEKTREESVILMDDLRLQGYRMWNKTVPVDYEHVRLLMVQLGRLHAVSFAMKEQRPEQFEQFKVPDPICTMMRSNEMFTVMLHMSLDRAIGVLAPEEDKLRQTLLQSKDTMFDDLQGLVDPKNCEPYAVLNHGDCWINNTIFKYENSTPSKIAVLDWQVSRYVSPALDLLYFIFCCTDGDFRHKHYEEILQLYHNSLTEHLEKLGGDASRQFPYEELLNQLKQHGRFGLMMAVFMVPMLCVENADLPDMNEHAEKMVESKEVDVSFMVGKSDGRYRKRMGEALRDLAAYGYV